MRQADYLAITPSLSAEARGLLDERRLEPTAFLINVARAEIVDELALCRALASGGMAGIATIPRARQRDHDPACVRLD